MSDETFTFLGFDAFATTAFCTAVLVAAYSLISNPTGRQSETDQAEYQVYSSWRLAMLAIVGQIILMIIVITQFADTTIPGNVKGWIIASMVAPWAPVAGKVRETLSSGLRVRRMMKSRLTRNELTAIIRDRFKFGQRGIALPSIIFHATRKLPQYPVAALRANPTLASLEDDIRREAKLTAQTEEEKALDLGALWVMNQSLQPSSIPKWRLFFWRLISIVDLLARLWTGRAVELAADPMPEVGNIIERARYLDIADLLQQGGTVSDELMERGMKRFCERCKLATRGTVEAFLESSERGHTDLRAGLWLKHINIKWAGNFERLIDVIWEATFIDGKAGKLGFEEGDRAKDFGDRRKVTTVKMLTLLFLITRSLMGGDKEDVYDSVAAIVAEGPFGYAWWERYWKAVVKRCMEKGLLDNVDDKWRAQVKGSLRDVIDEDFRCIVGEFLARSVKPVCINHDCFLHQAEIVFEQC